MQAHSTFRHTLRVTYADCTVGNHVYYARYFDFLEAARGGFFRMLGHPFQDLEDEGFAFPVIHCEADYRRAARYDERIHVDLWLTSLARIRLDVAYRIVTEDDRLLFHGLTRHACTDLENKGARIPGALAEKLTPYLAAERDRD
jgi:acyl-CoA thioester hydrolase